MGVSFRCRAFIRGRASNTKFTPLGGCLLEMRGLFESGHLLDHLR